MDKKSNCKNFSNKRKDDSDICNDQKKLIPVYGPPGPPGPPGPSLGSVIPYASGSKFQIPNVINSAITLGFGNYSLFNSENDALSNSEDAFIIPRDGKIKSLSIGSFLSQNRIELGIKVEIWKAESTSSGIFERFSPSIELEIFREPFFIGKYLQRTIGLNPAVPVVEGTSLLLVITFISAVGLKDPEFGFRGGLNIE